MLQGLFDGYPDWARAILVVVIVLTVACMVAEVLARLVGALIGRIDARASGELARRRATRAGLRVVRLIVTLLVAAVLMFPAMALVGLRPGVGLTPESLAMWVTGSGLRIGLIVLLSWLVTHVVALSVERLEGDVGIGTTVDAIERTKRARTLGTLVQTTAYTLVSSIALLMILRELHVDITPILTGAGIVGLAVGFGAQSLVKDIISGFFLILEDQVRVGDVANIDGTSGLVERITLRTIILRDETGTVHVIPNGSIQRLSNLTKDFSFYVTSIGVSYGQDPDEVVAVLRTVDEEMRGEPAFAPFMLAPLDVMGVDRLGESAVEVKVRLKTIPAKQWTVGREFLRRARMALLRAGVELPAPQRRVLPSMTPTVAPTGDTPTSDAPTTTPTTPATDA